VQSGAAHLLKDFGVTHVINVTMTTANARTSANLNPRSFGVYEICTMTVAFEPKTKES